MSSPNAGAIHYRVQLGLPDKGRVWDLEPLNLLNFLAVRVDC